VAVAPQDMALPEGESHPINLLPRQLHLEVLPSLRADRPTVPAHNDQRPKIRRPAGSDSDEN